ncbi:MAG: hypothetical protein WD795_06690 [Woeseia sp.]
MLILHYAEKRSGYDAAQRFVLAHRALEAFTWLHRGYNIKQMLQEFCDEIAPPFVPDGLAPVLTDYADYYRRKGVTVPPPGECFYLTGITRDEVMADPGSTMAPIFAYTPPRFLFSSCERRLLERALLGGTDTQLAHALGRALPTVKSLWRTIYNRVGRVDPALLSGNGAAEPGRQPTRGQEHPRRILQYLRHHPEELRPYAIPATANTRRRAV